MAEEVLWTGFDDKGLYAVRANKDENGNVIHETYATKSELEGKQDVISDLTTIREGAAAGATAVQTDDLATVATSGSYNDLSDKPSIPPEVVVDREYGPESANAQSGIAVAQAIATVPEQVNADWNSESGVSQILNKPDVIDEVEYDSSTKKILFKAGETLVAEIDATDFIKDGMVNDVKIDNGNLVITFNTDAGKEDITIPLSEIFDPDNYYNKGAVDDLLNNKVDKVEGKQLSTEDYTTAEKTKLAGVETGAQVNVIEGVSVNGSPLTPENKTVNVEIPEQQQADWGEDNSSKPSYIKNKPTPISIKAGSGISIVDENDDIVISTEVDASTKADKVSGATDGHFAGLDANGNLTDSGSKAADFATAAQGALAETAVQPGTLATVATTGDYDDLSNKPDLDVYATKTELAGKVDKVEGKQLSTEDYTTAEKTKLSGIDTGAQVNVQPDWEENDTTADSYIKNKPQEISLSNGRGIEITEATDTLEISTTAVLPADLATVATTGEYSDLNGAPVPISIVEGTGIDITESNNQIVISTDVDASTKADKVSGATIGNFAGLDANGNLTDSGFKASDFATAAQGALADTAVQDASYVHTDNNYTTAEKTKLTGIEDGAQVNVRSDWEETDNTSDAYIRNKPASIEIVGGTGITVTEDTTNNKLVIASTVDVSGKADKVANPTEGNLAALDATGNLTDSGSKAADFKTKQTAVVDPTASGSAIEFIDTIAQNANGEITATKKAVQPATDSSSGVMTASDKVKLDGIATGAEVNTVNTVSIGAGSAISPTSGTTNVVIPLAANSSGTGSDGAMSGADKVKLDGIAAGAEVNVQSDWAETDTTDDAYIANKPDILIPLDSPADQGGISAPKYIMVVTSMPAAANIDPDTIYLVQGTYIGT